MGERLLYYYRRKQGRVLWHTVEEIDRGYPVGHTHEEIDKRFTNLFAMLRRVHLDDSSSDQTDNDNDSLPDLEQA